MILKEHKAYFITKGEYVKKADAISWQFKMKGVYYGALFTLSLSMVILKAVTLFRF
jgi:hypothetical protein